MKQQLHKKLSEYRLIILDMDGTLYYQIPLRFCMCIEIVIHYIFNICRITDLFTLRRFRKSYENSVLEKENPVIEYWMIEKPLPYITFFRDRKLLRLVSHLHEQGAIIVIYSDYPVHKKIKALPELESIADYCFCADDDVIQCLKPDSKGLNNILYITNETPENSLFIGDRYEKDGKCAETAGLDYIILDNNPFLRDINLYKKEF